MQKMSDSKKSRVLNQLLAINMDRLRKERSIGGLREDMAQAGFAIGTGTLARLINGDEGVRIESMSKVAAYFGVDVEQLLRGDASPFVEIMRTNVRLAAGSGAIEGTYEELGGLSFRKDFLRSCGVIKPENARIVDVCGTSMEPTIPDGAVLLVNIANREPFSGKVFALAKAHEGLVVKRLIKQGEAWMARSDNPDGNPDFQINDGIPITIIGRAVWMGAKI